MEWKAKCVQEEGELKKWEEEKNTMLGVQSGKKTTYRYVYKHAWCYMYDWNFSLSFTSTVFSVGVAWFRSRDRALNIIVYLLPTESKQETGTKCTHTYVGGKRTNYFRITIYEI